MKMTVVTSRPDEQTIVIVIDHDAIASYSRSVQPRAMRAAREDIRAARRPGASETWALVDVDYDQTSPEGGRRTRTVYRYENQGVTP